MNRTVLLPVLLTACMTVVPSSRVDLPPSQPTFGWRLPSNDHRQNLREAITLAETIVWQPACLSQFQRFPDWPPGKVRTVPVYGGALAARVYAWYMADEDVIYVPIETILHTSTEALAAILIHELVHAATRSEYEQVASLNPDKEKDTEILSQFKIRRELQANGVMRLCVRAANLVL